MSSQVGDAALQGQWEQISNCRFEIREDMNLSFSGNSCNIINNNGEVVETLGTKDGEVTREVFAGYQCFVIRGKIKFERKLHEG
jgi:hypothetical protein